MKHRGRSNENKWEYSLAVMASLPLFLMRARARTIGVTVLIAKEFSYELVTRLARSGCLSTQKKPAREYRCIRTFFN